MHDALVALAAAHPDVEVCGLLFGTAKAIDDFERTANIAPDPARFFEIDPVALIAAHRRMRNGGPRITGYFHSHPGGPDEPSLTDIAQAAADDMLWMIVTGDGLRIWRATMDGLNELGKAVMD
jgi:desampylase